MDSGQTANLWAETEKLIDIQGNQSAAAPVELRLRDHGKDGDQEPKRAAPGQLIELAE